MSKNHKFVEGSLHGAALVEFMAEHDPRYARNIRIGLEVQARDHVVGHNLLRWYRGSARSRAIKAGILSPDNVPALNNVGLAMVDGRVQAS